MKGIEKGGVSHRDAYAPVCWGSMGARAYPRSLCVCVGDRKPLALLSGSGRGHFTVLSMVLRDNWRVLGDKRRHDGDGDVEHDWEPWDHPSAGVVRRMLFPTQEVILIFEKKKRMFRRCTVRSE